MTGPPDVSVILMPWGRVGSNLCADILLQSRCIRLENEPLTVIQTQNPGIGREELAALQMKWLHDNVQPREDVRKIVLKLSALSISSPEAFIAFLRETNATLVMMDRRDVLATAVSALRAREFARKNLAETGTALWALKNGMTADVKPLMDAAVLRRFINNILGAKLVCETIAAAVPVRATILYEDLNNHLEAEIARLVEAVGLEPFTYEVRHLKFTPMPLRQSVANPDVLEKVAAEFGLPLD
jgi:hypothetical protein